MENLCFFNRQYSNMAPRHLGQNCKFLKFLLAINFQKRPGYKENNTKDISLSGNVGTMLECEYISMVAY